MSNRSGVAADAFRRSRTDPRPATGSAPGWHPARRWVGPARSSRVRILTSYVILLAFCAILSTVVARQVLTLRLEARVEGELSQEILELDRLVRDGRDPDTGAAFTSAGALLDLYLGRNVTSEGEAVLTFVDGQQRSASLVRYPLPSVPAAVAADWLAASRGQGKDNVGGADAGSYETTLGTGHFQSRAFTLGDESGLFVVTRLPASELREINEIGRFGLLADVGVLALATLLAWPIAGRVLAPVRQLTETAQAISESDMTSRVPVQTTGEAAEMARSFNAMLDRLEQVLASQREFVRRAGHEMRDPLAICRGHLELLDHDAPDAEATTRLVMDELDRMARLVGDLEILADSEQRDFVRPEPLALDLLTHELVAKSTVMGRRHWALDAAADVTVLADRHRLTEAVMNLVHNAVMHTSERDTIAIGTAADGDEWQLWVRDTGVGLPAEPELFEPYVRGDLARARYQGAGLGLAIVRLVAESHGGRVKVDGLPGLGATFTMIMPVRPPSLARADGPEDGNEGTV
ncbi:ATP-binding protein [Humibacillus xanthopallidus]|uniref:sensor histidine kinase n=1 Tax=Humibacillus xanthopallidus TaxID=412689 RepID=UPI00384A77EF